MLKKVILSLIPGSRERQESAMFIETDEYEDGTSSMGKIPKPLVENAVIAASLATGLPPDEIVEQLNQGGTVSFEPRGVGILRTFLDFLLDMAEGKHKNN